MIERAGSTEAKYILVRYLEVIQLQGHCYQEVKMEGDKLTGANITDAEVNMADISGANLTGAKLKTGSEESSEEGEGPIAKVPRYRGDYLKRLMPWSNQKKITFFSDFVKYQGSSTHFHCFLSREQELYSF